MKYKLFLYIHLYFICLFSGSIYSQTMSIEGQITDSTGVNPIQNALIYNVRISDSLLLSYTRTDKGGLFRFDSIPIDTFTMYIFADEYKTRKLYIVGSEENNNISLNTVKLATDNINTIDELIIFAYKTPIFFKGDTLVFIADSFDVKKNAMVEDLLKKIPGFTVSNDGQLTVNGKKIDRVFVDGDEFFGNDPTIATKNLNAKAIDQIKVYEQEQISIDSGDKTENILDLTLKEDAKKDHFGKIGIATDFTQYHLGELLYNRFSNKKKYLCIY